MMSLIIFSFPQTKLLSSLLQFPSLNSNGDHPLLFPHCFLSSPPHGFILSMHHLLCLSPQSSSNGETTFQEIRQVGCQDHSHFRWFRSHLPTRQHAKRVSNINQSITFLVSVIALLSIQSLTNLIGVLPN